MVLFKRAHCPVSETILFAAWFLSGVGALLTISLWGLFLAQLLHRQAVVYTTVSALIAVLVFGLVKVALKQSIWPYASMIIALLCILLFFFKGLSYKRFLWQRFL